MTDINDTIGEARELLAAHHDAKAIEILRDAIHATTDAEVLSQVHDFAVNAHEQAGGFHKVEWQRLMIESEPPPGSTPVDDDERSAQG